MSVDDYILLVYKNLEGELSVEEFANLNQLTAERQDFAQVRLELEATWDAVSGEPLLVDSSETTDLFSKIIGEKKEVTPIIPATNSSNPKVRRLSPVKIMARISTIAAVLLIAVGAWFVFKTDTTVYDSPGVYTLADQSEVTLRSGTLTIDDFGESQRKVTMNGEAVFKIAKDAERPFRITTQHAKVEVLGTEFLIKEAGDELYIHLFEGKLSSMDTRSLESKILTAGMNIKHTADGKIITDDVYPNLSVWNRGNVQYKNVNILKVIDELSFIFGQEITIERTEMQTCKVTAFINGARLEDILQRFASSFDMKVHKEENQWILKGGTCK